MQKSKSYTIIFSLLVALAVSLLISLVSYKLKDRQNTLKSEYLKKNILKAVGALKGYNQKVKNNNSTSDDINSYFRKYISTLVLDSSGAPMKKQPVGGYKIDLYKELKNHKYNKNSIDNKGNARVSRKKTVYLPLFIYKADGKVISYCFPLAGKGLWSTIKGYIALESDLNTIKGISFYEQGETAGLGGEIQSKEFTTGFKGKKIFHEKSGEIRISVLKGKGLNNSVHQVDGITGATLTCRGVTKLMKNSLSMYRPYIDFLKTHRRSVSHEN